MEYIPAENHKFIFQPNLESILEILEKLTLEDVLNGAKIGSSFMDDKFSESKIIKMHLQQMESEWK